MKIKALISFVSLVIFVLLLSSCSPATVPATNTLVRLTSTITPSPFPTFTPTITPSPTPIPGPWYGIPITTENANQVRHLAIWGKGLAWISSYNYYPSEYMPGDDSYPELTKIGLGNLWTDLATDIAAQGKIYVVRTARGVYLYSTTSSSLITEIDGAIVCKVSDDGNFIITGHNDASIRIWNALNGTLMREFQYTLKEPKDLLSTGPNLIPSIGDVTISRDDKMLAAGFADGTVVVWTAEDSTPKLTIDTNIYTIWQSNVDGQGVRALTFSPDGQYLMALNYDNVLSLWQIKDGKEKWVVHHAQDTFPRFPFSPDGKFFAIYGSGTFGYDGGDVAIIDAKDGSVYSFFDIKAAYSFTKDDSFKRRHWIAKLSFSSNWEQMIVDYSLSNERVIREWPSGEVKETIPLPREPLSNLLFDLGHLWGLAGAKAQSENIILAWGSTNNLIYWWDFSKNKLVGYPKEMVKSFFSEDGKFAAVCQNGEISIFTSEGIYKNISVPGHQTCDGITFSPDQDTFAVWTRNRIALVSISTATIQNIVGHQNPIAVAAFSSDGVLLASAEAVQPGNIYIWETKPVKKYSQIVSKNDRYVSFFPADPYYVLEFSQDNKILASRGYGNSVRLWNINDGSLIGSVNVSADKIAFSPDGHVLASANRAGLISLWSIPDGEKLSELRGHAHLFQRTTGINDAFPVFSFPPDGLGTLSLEYESGHGGWTTFPISYLSFLSDGTGILSIGTDGTIRLWGIDPNITSPIALPPITYPIFENISFNETIDYSSSWKFRVYPVINAKAFLWEFYQNSQKVCSIQVSGDELEVTKESNCGQKLTYGELIIYISALINNKWTTPTITTVILK